MVLADSFLLAPVRLSERRGPDGSSAHLVLADIDRMALVRLLRRRGPDGSNDGVVLADIVPLALVRLLRRRGPDGSNEGLVLADMCRLASVRLFHAAAFVHDRQHAFPRMAGIDKPRQRQPKIVLFLRQPGLLKRMSHFPSPFAATNKSNCLCSAGAAGRDARRLSVAATICFSVRFT